MSSTSRDQTNNPFNARVIAVVLLVAILSFIAWVTLLAWSPELAKRDNAGPHPYAKSATGYGGLVSLLKAQNIPVSVSRISRSIEDHERGLMILTLEPYGMGAKLEDMYLAPPALIVLPKWTAPPDRAKPEWARDMSLMSTDTVERTLEYFDEDGRILQASVPDRVNTPYGRFEPDFTEKIQLIESSTLEPVIRSRTGTLLARMPDEEIYILSDPDVLNTLGLASFENARLATMLINSLRQTADTPVVLDATLHGFERSDNLLKLALDIPYIGATLITFVALAMLGWSALIRFGSPGREGRSIALGKEALAENTAGLITMARRETQMAPGYLTLTRRVTAKTVGAPPTLSETELADLFDRMSETGNLSANWTQLAHSLASRIRSRDDFIERARALYLWRQEITHGHK